MNLQPCPKRNNHETVRISFIRLQTAGYSRRTDIWSIGCIVREMLSGHAPFSESQWQGDPKAFKFKVIYHTGGLRRPYVIRRLNALHHSCRGLARPALPGNIGPEAVSFLNRCFVITPSQRMSAQQLLAEPFVAGHVRSGGMCPCGCLGAE